MRLRTLIVFDLVLLTVCVPGIFDVLAKDQVSTAEGVVALISAAGFAVFLLALLVLLAVSVRRLAKRPRLR